MPHRPIASRLHKPQPEEVHDKFPLVEEREFGFPMRAAGENDGSLDKTRAVAQEFAKERRLKGIAARRKMLEIAVGNQIGPDHAIPGGAITDGRDASEPTHQASPRQADEFAMPREAGDRSPRSEARADHHVVTIVGKADHPRQNGRVVLEIGVHLENQMGLQGPDCVSDTSLVCFAQPIFFAGNEMKMRKALHGFAHALCRAVRRIIVHNQNMQFVRRDSIRLRKDPGKNGRNVLGLIESRKDDAGDWFCHLCNCEPETLFGATCSGEFPLKRGGVRP